MNNSNAFLTIAALIAVVFVLLVIGMRSGINCANKEAIEAGVAEWRIDPKTGEKSFEYLKP